MVFEILDKKNKSHEQVVFCLDRKVNLKAIISIHSTSLGPALGGCRMFPYETENQALEDVLRLSEAMSHKAAVAGLPLGGGKSVIIGDPDKDKTTEMLKSFGRYIESLKGKYVVSKDMGITTTDLQCVAKECNYVMGRPLRQGGIGDPSRWTAQGVFYGIQKVVKWKLKKDSLKGLRVLIQGLGAVGYNLLEFLYKEGVEIFAFDIKQEILNDVKSKFPKVHVISKNEVFSTACDIFAPCSISFVINKENLEKLQCSIVAGGANNQLHSSAMDNKLMEKGILYVPDFVINGGGLIYASSCISPKKSEDWVNKKIKDIPKTIQSICERSASENVGTAEIAVQIAKERIEHSRIGVGA